MSLQGICGSREEKSYTPCHVPRSLLQDFSLSFEMTQVLIIPPTISLQTASTASHASSSEYVGPFCPVRQTAVWLL